MQAKSKSSFPLNIHRFEITSKYNQDNENNLLQLRCAFFFYQILPRTLAVSFMLIDGYLLPLVMSFIPSASVIICV